MFAGSDSGEAQANSSNDWHAINMIPSMLQQSQKGMCGMLVGVPATPKATRVMSATSHLI